MKSRVILRVPHLPKVKVVKRSPQAKDGHFSEYKIFVII
jgi:hypothetical protein